jgi:hypothetical protein
MSKSPRQPLGRQELESSLKLECDRLAKHYPDLFHVVVWPESDWGNWKHAEQRVHADDSVWQMAIGAAAGSRLQWPGGYLLLGDTLVAGRFFEYAPPSTEGMVSMHEALAADHQKTYKLADAVAAFSHLSTKVVDCFEIPTGEVERPRKDLAEDRWLEVIYTELDPPVDERHVPVVSSEDPAFETWLVRRLPYGVFSASGIVVNALSGHVSSVDDQSLKSAGQPRDEAEEPRLCYGRDHEWLRWTEEYSDGTRNVCGKIRDRWNALLENDRKQISPRCYEEIPKGKPGWERVRKGIAAARRDRETKPKN